jgi:hypothetical protein
MHHEHSRKINFVGNDDGAPAPVTGRPGIYRIMPVARRILLVAGMVSFSLVAGCAARDPIVRLYKNESIDQAFGNLLVVAVYSDANGRRDFEAAMVKALRASGTSARYSLEFVRSTDEIDHDLLTRVAADAGVDGVLVSIPTAIDRRLEVDEGRSRTTVQMRYGGSLYDWFSVEFTEYQDPMELIRTGSVVIETDLYRVSDETRVWSARSEAIDKNSVFQAASDQASAITALLKRDGLINSARAN